MIQTRSAADVTRVRHPAWPGEAPGMWIASYLGLDSTMPRDAAVPAPNELFPCAFVIEHDPGVAGPPHYHEANEFQVVVAGSGKFGKKPIARGSVHYAAAYSPYGPIVAGDDGLSYMTLRDTFTLGARIMPAARERLREAGIRPFSLVADYEPIADIALRTLGTPERIEVIAPRPDGLAVWSYRLPPGASFTGEPPGGGGQFWLVTAGAQATGGGLVSAPTSTFVSTGEPPYRVQAGPAGLEILALQFPVRAREGDHTMKDAQPTRRTALAGLAAVAAAAAFPAPIRAAAPLNVGKSTSGIFAYTPIDVGLKNGYYQKGGLDLNVQTFNGAAKMQAALISGDIDIALGSGTSMLNILKGEESLTVAETLGPPTELAIIVPYDSPVKTVDDLKGKTFGVASTGSVTEWMAFELARVRGWGPDGVKTVGTGGGPATIAALRAHALDAVVGTASIAYMLEPQKVMRIVTPCSSYVKEFIMHTIFASDNLVKTRPADLRAFLAAWFQAAAYMRTHRDETIKIASEVNAVDEVAQAKEYDIVAPSLSIDGRFSRPALAVIARSFVDLKMVDAPPDLSKTWTEAYLPPVR